MNFYNAVISHTDHDNDYSKQQLTAVFHPQHGIYQGWLNFVWWCLLCVGPQYGTSLTSWHLEFWGDSQIFGKFVHRWQIPHLAIQQQQKHTGQKLTPMNAHSSQQAPEWTLCTSSDGQWIKQHRKGLTDLSPSKTYWVTECESWKDQGMLMKRLSLVGVRL
jgi:hypothetical protein